MLLIPPGNLPKMVGGGTIVGSSRQSGVIIGSCALLLRAGLTKVTHLFGMYMVYLEVAEIAEKVP